LNNFSLICYCNIVTYLLRLLLS